MPEDSAYQRPRHDVITAIFLLFPEGHSGGDVLVCLGKTRKKWSCLPLGLHIVLQIMLRAIVAITSRSLPWKNHFIYVN